MIIKHTPGPWIVSPTVEGMLGIFADVTHRQDGYLDACVCAVSAIMDKTEVDEANAHLIAAAPELLEALEGIASATCEKWEMPYADFKKQFMPWARNVSLRAIAKAKGETK